MPRGVQYEEIDRENQVNDLVDEEMRRMREASCEEPRPMQGARGRDAAIIAERAGLEARKSDLDQRRVGEDEVLVHKVLSKVTPCSK
jgi:hypothetical protein